ncbi:MAG: TauD/TfdA dioxygenase family protein [Dermatophilaceae bacterium]
MPINLHPLHPLFVVHVTGVDLRAPMLAETFTEIHDALDRFGIIVFREQNLTDDEQLAFTQRFGPVESAPNYAGNALRLPGEFTDISNLDSKGRLLDPEDRLAQYNLGNQLWHTDSSFKAIRAKCSLLSAREIPESGSATQYADMRSAYEALTAERKEHIDGLVAEHSIAHSRSLTNFDGFNDDVTTSLPPVPQRLVDHYDDGRSSLYLASHASHVRGLPIEEGRALLTQLMDHATQDQFVYTHDWAVGDLVVWDNRRTMHRGRPYDMTQRRVLHRTTVSDVETPFDATLVGS